MALPFQQWDWQKIQECFMIAVSKPSFISIISDSLIHRFENYFSIFSDRSSFYIPYQPVNVGLLNDLSLFSLLSLYWMISHSSLFFDDLSLFFHINDDLTLSFTLLNDLSWL